MVDVNIYKTGDEVDYYIEFGIDDDINYQFHLTQPITSNFEIIENYNNLFDYIYDFNLLNNAIFLVLKSIVDVKEKKAVNILIDANSDMFITLSNYKQTKYHKVLPIAYRKLYIELGKIYVFDGVNYEETEDIFTDITEEEDDIEKFIEYGEFTVENFKSLI